MRPEIVNVLADANVLWSPQLRNLFLQLAHQDVFHIFWTDLVIEEWLRNIEPDQRARCEAGTVPLMRRHFPEAWLPAMTPTPFGTTDPKDPTSQPPPSTWLRQCW
ncbi:hypothetical protein VQ03_16320 [Methylobacterium tarhaniae]|uniref:PIN domain-containing protein n=1 Tax=Methylobacterium tarhaniae TaxID=1187852 RepID=A0A0J6SUL7_9HYPH|nr:hypothetical protein [Methylobacterium tarhaniae]KMO38975.1 hypothetical protein VQ03_16320 [Methylobacterium tarhaniae]